MRKIYYLASCDTCRKIIKSLPSNANLEFHDIRQNPITIAELEFMHQLSGSYEALFSKKGVANVVISPIITSIEKISVLIMPAL